MAVGPEFDGIAILAPKHNPEYIELTAEQNGREIQFGSYSFHVPSTGKQFEAMLGYRRCFDFDSTNSPGQDFAALRFDAQYSVGVLADGVSQSFFGDLAAAQLSSFLVDYLWTRRQKPPRKNELESELKRLEESVAPAVHQRQIPETAPPMQRAALEKGRAKGSQAVFGAFTLDNRNQCLLVYQVGDVRILVYRAGLPPATVSADPRGRWSTGGTSVLMLEVASYSNVEEVMIASDGVSAGWEREWREGTSSRDSFQAMAAEQAAKDDVSFVAIRQAASPVAPTGGKLAGKVVWVDGSDSNAPPKPDQAKPAREWSKEALVVASAKLITRGGRSLPEPLIPERWRIWLGQALWTLLIFCLGGLAGFALALRHKVPIEPGTPAIGKKAQGRPAGRAIQVHASEISNVDLIREFLDTVQPVSHTATIRVVFSGLEGYQATFSCQTKGVIVPNPIEVGRSRSDDNSYSTVVYVKGLPDTASTILGIHVSDRTGPVVSSELAVEAKRVYAVTVQRGTP